MAVPEGCSKNKSFPGTSALFREECTNLCSNHELYIKKNFFERSALFPLKLRFLEQPSEVSGILELGNVWGFVQLIFGPHWPMNQLNNNPNITQLQDSSYL